MCGRGRAGARQERTAQYGGRMFVFATTQGVQGDMPSAMRLALREKSKNALAPCCHLQHIQVHAHIKADYGVRSLTL